ncbi:MAG TPA: CHAT domain-containing protein [Pyrinomonadaceae bacterium]|nr:CHAT domain-containing protein [Pyrinomonadaceae bacterium]
MNIKEITIRINTSGAGGFVLQLIDSDGTLVEENLPADLKVGRHAGDYNTFRETFVKEADESRVFSDIGQHLLALLYVGQVGERLKQLKRDRRPGERFRVLFDVERGNENIALLPWELMFDGVNQRPFQKLDDSIIRIHKYGPAEAPGIEPLTWPIRVLIVVGVKDASIAADREVTEIEEVLRPVNRLVDVEPLWYPTIDDLEKACRCFRPHVLHYIGHGGTTATRNPFILLQQAGGGNDPWTADQIDGSLQTWGWIPRFAFINACRTAGRDEATIQDQIAAWGVADAFHGLHVPAVLTMQADIKGAVAGEFAGATYRRLAQGEPIDLAVAAARVKIRDITLARDKNLKRDWATPTLTVSMPPEDILSMTAKADTDLKNAIERCARFQEVSILANCREDRRNFIQGFYPLPQIASKDLMIVRGVKESGKTWITLWCLEGCALQNHNVRYVEVSSKSPKWLDVLTQIQTGDPSKKIGDEYQLIYRPLKQEAFYEFNHELRYRLKNQTPPEWDGRPVLFERPDSAQLDNLPDNTVAEIFKSFRKALINAAEPNQDLIIVLDQFTYNRAKISEPHMKKFLIPFLFEQAAVGALKSDDRTRVVKFVLVLSEEELKTYPELSELKAYWHDVYLQGIPAKEFDKVMKEYFNNLRRSNSKRPVNILREDEDEFWITRFRREISDPWHPSFLGYIGKQREKLERSPKP